MLRRDEVQVGALLRYQEGAGFVTWWRVVEIEDERVTLEMAEAHTPAANAEGRLKRTRKSLKRSTVAGKNWRLAEAQEVAPW